MRVTGHVTEKLTLIFSVFMGISSLEHEYKDRSTPFSFALGNKNDTGRASQPLHVTSDLHFPLQTKKVYFNP